MTERATQAWTEFRPRFALTAAVLLAAGVLAGIETGATRVVLLLVVVATVAVSLARDGYGGIVVGLGGALVLVVGRRLLGTFTVRDFFLVVGEVIVVLAVPWLVAILGHHQRRSIHRLDKPVSGAVVPAQGSLGLLERSVGLIRLDEELGRCRRTGGPLSLALIAHEPATDSVRADVVAAERSVVRHVESLAREADVPFALDERTIAIALPDCDTSEAVRVLGRIVAACADATFTTDAGGQRVRERVGAVLLLRSGVVAATEGQDSATLVAVGREALERTSRAAGPSRQR